MITFFIWETTLRAGFYTHVFTLVVVVVVVEKEKNENKKKDDKKQLGECFMEFLNNRY